MIGSQLWRDVLSLIVQISAVEQCDAMTASPDTEDKMTWNVSGDRKNQVQHCRNQLGTGVQGLGRVAA